jgi:hypothetical protein
MRLVDIDAPPINEINTDIDIKSSENDGKMRR